MSLAAVFFDLDGTLTDTEKLCAMALEVWVRRIVGSVVPPKEMTVGISTDAVVRLVYERAGIEPDADKVADGCSWLLTNTKRIWQEHLRLRPGAAELLQAVYDAGLPTALVTSTPRDLAEVALAKLGRRYFTYTVCGDEVGRTKPDPEPYASAARMLGVDPRSCVAIEDSPTGAESAAAAGCRVLVVPSEVPVPAADHYRLRTSLRGVSVRELESLLA